MANFSLSEIDALARKATRGAGYSWGLAEEVGKSVRWLSAYGFSGVEVLAEHLSLIADNSEDYIPDLKKLDSDEKTFENNNQPSCSIYCGSLINDLGHHLNEDKILSFNTMLSPLLALPSAARVAETYNISVSFTLAETSIICNSNGIELKGTPPLLSGFQPLPAGKLKQLSRDARLGGFPERSIQNVICNREDGAFKNTHFPSPQSRPIKDEAMIILEKFAHKTYAPATEESRLRGAG